MIVEGLKLTLLGMGVVYAFLGLLIVVIRLNARMLKPLTDREEAAHRAFSHRRKAPRQEQELAEKRRVLAVISAAITAHRARAGLASCRPPAGKEPGPFPRPMPAARRAQPPPVAKTVHGSRLAQLLFRDRSTTQGFRQAKK